MTIQDNEKSRRLDWVVIDQDGTIHAERSVSEYEMKQLSELVGGEFRQVPLASLLPKHRLGAAIRSAAVNDRNQNNTATSLLNGIRVAGPMVIGQRRATDTAMFKGQREGIRYIIPFLHSEAEEVVAELKSKR